MQYASPLKLDYHFNNCNTASVDTSIFVTAHMPFFKVAICDVKDSTLCR